jgi:enoyl-CoA hydratase
MEGAATAAGEIAANAPLAVQATKDVLNYGVGKSVEDGLKYVASLSTNIVPSEDLMEAMSAFVEKRRPNFTGN